MGGYVRPLSRLEIDRTDSQSSFPLPEKNDGKKENRNAFLGIIGQGGFLACADQIANALSLCFPLVFRLTEIFTSVLLAVVCIQLTDHTSQSGSPAQLECTTETQSTR